jgi:hypothetical protein
MERGRVNMGVEAIEEKRPLLSVSVAATSFVGSIARTPFLS